jgi:alginate O-acetyltransferase complex protein AlgI
VLFVEFRYFIFFGAVFALYWLMTGRSARKVVLLASSYIFYSLWDWRFLSLVLLSTLTNYYFGARLHLAPTEAGRKRWLWLSVLLNFGMLATFKYFGFFYESFRAFAGLFMPPDFPTIDLVLPLGLSFYTLQAASYCLDIYWKRIQPSSKLLDFAVFIAFFPQLLMGPIVKAREFLPQLEEDKSWAQVQVRHCLFLFLYGYFKKAVVSDNLSFLLDPYFADPGAYTGASSRIALVLNGLQLYCDFSGYSNMAVASAGLLGLKIPENFFFPFFARNFAQFFQRWNMTMFQWLKEYLYIPLLSALPRKEPSIYFGLFVVCLAAGLWHGSTVSFFASGLFCGIGIVGATFFSRLVGRAGIVFPHWAAMLLTLAWFSGTAIFLRDIGLRKVALIFAFISGGDGGGIRELPAQVLWVVPALALVHYLAYRRKLDDALALLPWPVAAALFGVLTALVLSFVPESFRKFVYLNF